MTKPRKKKKYRPIPVLQSPVEYVLESVRKIDHTIPEVQALRYAVHDAAVKLTKGQAVRRDMEQLIAASNMVEALLATTDLGADVYADVAADGKQALTSICRRDKFVAKGVELTAINEMLVLHDTLLETISLGELTAAVVYVKKQIQHGKAEVI